MSPVPHAGQQEWIPGQQKKFAATAEEPAKFKLACLRPRFVKLASVVRERGGSRGILVLSVQAKGGRIGKRLYPYGFLRAWPTGAGFSSGA